jgi:signal transduction histidine kinase
MLQYRARQRRETTLDKGNPQARTNPCNATIITRNESRSAVRVRSSALWPRLFAPGFGGSSAGTQELLEAKLSKEKKLTERNTNPLERAPEEARQEWLGMLQSLAEQIQKQQQNSQQMVQQMMDTYMQLLNTPGSYLSGQAEQQQQTLQQTAQQWMEQAQQQRQTFQQQAQQQQQSFQQMVQESMNTYMQMFNIPHSYLQEGMRLAQQDTPRTARER